MRSHELIEKDNILSLQTELIDRLYGSLFLDENFNLIDRLMGVIKLSLVLQN